VASRLNYAGRVRHGKSVTVGDIKITFYQFGLLLTDSAIVIEAEDVVILNANDAKLAGAPLQNILDIHGPIDFALRSHSSANSRVCRRVVSDDEFKPDDREHYFRSFKLFMDVVSPKYAIPFASNHCHLHKDVRKFNEYISDPYELAAYSEGINRAWDLQIMLPGAEWSSLEGFNTVSDCHFTDKHHHIEKYIEAQTQALTAYEEKESRVTITPGLIDAFQQILSKLWWVRTKLTIYIRITYPEKQDSVLAVRNRQVAMLHEEGLVEKGSAMIVIPAIIFRDAVMKNMFHHAAISKRLEFIAFNESDMTGLMRFFSALEIFELTDRLSPRFFTRLLMAYIHRWRELRVYLSAAYFSVIKRKKMYEVEELILKSGGNK
jgi:UDP-MurNAc hydroxylase